MRMSCHPPPTAGLSADRPVRLPGKAALAADRMEGHRQARGRPIARITETPAGALGAVREGADASVSQSGRRCVGGAAAICSYSERVRGGMGVVQARLVLPARL